jgi:hypothetical protein
MIRVISLSLLTATGLGLCACSSQPAAKPKLSYIDVARAPPPVEPAVAASQAQDVEQGRILKVRQASDMSFAYTVQRIRDDSVIEVNQADQHPLPAGLKVSISYGSPVHIEAVPIPADLG